METGPRHAATALTDGLTHATISILGGAAPVA